METTSGRLSTDEIIFAVSQLSLPELEQVFDHILSLKAERKGAHSSAEESGLLSLPELMNRLGIRFPDNV